MTKNKVSLRAMSAYEKLTGRNAIKTLEVGDKITATDLIGILFMAMYTTDKNVTLEQVEEMDQDQITKMIADLSTPDTSLVPDGTAAKQ